MAACCRPVCSSLLHARDRGRPAPDECACHEQKWLLAAACLLLRLPKFGACMAQRSSACAAGSLMYPLLHKRSVKQLHKQHSLPRQQRHGSALMCAPSQQPLENVRAQARPRTAHRRCTTRPCTRPFAPTTAARPSPARRPRSCCRHVHMFSAALLHTCPPPNLSADFALRIDCMRVVPTSRVPGIACPLHMQQNDNIHGQLEKS